MSSAGSFAKLPVTKALFFTSLSASVLWQAARGSKRSFPRGVQLLSNSLVFRTPGELIFGAFLLYYFRLVERQLGSAKYSAYASFTVGLSSLAQLILSRLLPSRFSTSLMSGPYSLIAASCVHYFFSVPGTSKFSVLGVKLSDKAFVYLAAGQLLLSGGVPSATVGALAALAGALWHWNVGGVQRLRFPGIVRRFCASTFGPWLSEGDGSGAAGASASTPGAASAGRASRSGATAGGVGSRRSAAAAAAGTGAGGGVGADTASGVGGAQAFPAVSSESLETLTAMGFDSVKASRALQLVGNDVQAALALLL